MLCYFASEAYVNTQWRYVMILNRAAFPLQHNTGSTSNASSCGTEEQPSDCVSDSPNTST